MKLIPFRFGAVVLYLTSAITVNAEVRLPALFSDHMVLQQGKTSAVWGWADAGEKITVAIADQTKTVVTGADGKWSVKLDQIQSKSPLQLTVQSTNKIVVNDVLVGEVWLCAGQSNMVMPVSGSKDFEKERTTVTLPQIRMFTVKAVAPHTEQSDCKGAWVVCSPETVGTFSATAFFFGRELHQRLGGSVGLIVSAAGGTVIESWLNKSAQESCADLKPYFVQREKLLAALNWPAADLAHQKALKKWETDLAAAKAARQPLPPKPRHAYASRMGKLNLGGLFNGMIAPLIPYTLRGIAWYQGESNANPDRAAFYEDQLRLLVTDWRTRWGEELPIAWVQLPNHDQDRPWAEIREAQLKCLDLPKTAMAITIDAGESKDIHPKDKQTVGHRLALAILGTVYGEKVSAVSGPLPDGHQVRGGEIVTRFKHTTGGLVSRDGPLKGFMIAGKDCVWKSAEARIQGDTVILSSPDVPMPVAVRYAWASDPICNLYNGSGLPASPFRTDDWAPTTP